MGLFSTLWNKLKGANMNAEQFLFPADATDAVERNFNAIHARFGSEYAMAYLVTPSGGHGRQIRKMMDEVGEAVVNGLIARNEPGPDRQGWPLWMIDNDTEGAMFHPAEAVKNARGVTTGSKPTDTLRLPAADPKFRAKAKK